MLKLILDLIFPENCLFCGSSEELFCHYCLQKQKTSVVASKKILNKVSGIKQVIVASDYQQQQLAKLIRHYKYHGIYRLAQPLAEILIACLEVQKFNNIDLVLAVPLHKKRQIRRGFNQAELLAKNISQHFSWSISDKVIVRKFNTVAQVKLNKDQRKQNVIGVFEVLDKKIIKNKRILLVDDVITTGATLSECAKILLKNGATEVQAIVIAQG